MAGENFENFEKFEQDFIVQDFIVMQKFDDEKKPLIVEQSHAFSLFEILRKAASPPNYNSNQKNNQIDEVHLKNIAQYAPVNTLMLDYYLEQLSYQPMFLKNVNNLKRNSTRYSKRMSVRLDDKNLQEDHEWILIQLRTTLMLLAHAAIMDAKMGKPIQHWLDKVEQCYNQIQRWNQNEEREMQKSGIAHHVQYLACLLNYDIEGVQRDLANPGVGLLRIEIENFAEEPTFSEVKDYLKSKDAVLFIQEECGLVKMLDNEINNLFGKKFPLYILTEKGFYYYENQDKPLKLISIPENLEIDQQRNLKKAEKLKKLELFFQEDEIKKLSTAQRQNIRSITGHNPGKLYYAHFKQAKMEEITDDKKDAFCIKNQCKDEYKTAGYNLARLIKSCLAFHKDNIGIGHYAGEKIGNIRKKLAFWMPIADILFVLTKLISNCFLYAKRLQKILEKPDRRNDTAYLILNLVLFPLRLGLFLYALVDRRKESKLPFKERLQRAWGDHGVDLLRSLFLTAVNCLIYFWLHGAGKLDFIGKITNISALAGVEIVLGLIKGVFAAIHYRANLREMNATLNKLLPLQENKILDRKEKQFIQLNQLITASNEAIIIKIQKALNTQGLNGDELETRTKQVWAIIHVARKAHVEYIAKRNTYIILTLQGLMNAMATAMVMFQLFPLMLGPIFYVASSVFNNLATSANEIYKTGKTIERLLLEQNLCIEEKRSLKLQIFQCGENFKNENVKAKEKIDEELLASLTNVMKRLSVCNEICDRKQTALEKDIIFQHALRDYQKIVAVTNTIFDAAVAIGLFAMFTFLPFGIVPIAIAVGVMLAVLITKTVAEKCFKEKIIDARIEVQKVSLKSMFASKSLPYIDSKSKDEINDLGDKEDLVLN